MIFADAAISPLIDTLRHFDYTLFITTFILITPHFAIVIINMPLDDCPMMLLHCRQPMFTILMLIFAIFHCRLRFFFRHAAAIITPLAPLPLAPYYDSVYYIFFMLIITPTYCWCRFRLRWLIASMPHAAAPIFSIILLILFLRHCHAVDADAITLMLSDIIDAALPRCFAITLFRYYWYAIDAAIIIYYAAMPLFSPLYAIIFITPCCWYYAITFFHYHFHYRDYFDYFSSFDWLLTLLRYAFELRQFSLLPTFTPLISFVTLSFSIFFIDYHAFFFEPFIISLTLDMPILHYFHYYFHTFILLIITPLLIIIDSHLCHIIIFITIITLLPTHYAAHYCRRCHIFISWWHYFAFLDDADMPLMLPYHYFHFHFSPSLLSATLMTLPLLIISLLLAFAIFRLFSFFYFSFITIFLLSYWCFTLIATCFITPFCHYH